MNNQTAPPRRSRSFRKGDYEGTRKPRAYAPVLPFHNDRNTRGCVAVIATKRGGMHHIGVPAFLYCTVTAPGRHSYVAIGLYLNFYQLRGCRLRVRWQAPLVEKTNVQDLLDQNLLSLLIHFIGANRGKTPPGIVACLEKSKLHFGMHLYACKIFSPLQGQSSVVLWTVPPGSIRVAFCGT